MFAARAQHLAGEEAKDLPARATSPIAWQGLAFLA
jgi:hypothetical protein